MPGLWAPLAVLKLIRTFFFLSFFLKKSNGQNEAHATPQLHPTPKVKIYPALLRHNVESPLRN